MERSRVAQGLSELADKNVLKSARAQSDMTQEEFARVFGSSRSTLQRQEEAERAVREYLTENDPATDADRARVVKGMRLLAADEGTDEVQAAVLRHWANRLNTIVVKRDADYAPRTSMRVQRG